MAGLLGIFTRVATPRVGSSVARNTSNSNARKEKKKKNKKSKKKTQTEWM